MLEMFSTLLSVLMILGAGAAGFVRYRQANRETIASGMEDLARIAESKDTVIESLESDLARMERRVAELAETVGRVQGYNDILLREKFLNEEYIRLLLTEMRAAGLAIPARRQF